MLMRESRQCNLNSVDIYCQGVLIHRPLCCSGLLSTSRPQAPSKTCSRYCTLSRSPSDGCCDRRHTTPHPIGHRHKTQGYRLVECHLSRLCPLSTETPSERVSGDVPASSASVTTRRIAAPSLLHLEQNQACLLSVSSISGQTLTIIC